MSNRRLRWWRSTAAAPSARPASPAAAARVRRRVAAFAAALSLAGVPAVAGACGSTPQSAVDRFITAFNALDWDAFRSCLADSVSLFNPDIPDAISLHRLDGRADVERSFRVVFGSATSGPPSRGPDIHPEHLSLQQFSDAAIVTFEFRRSAHSFGRRSIFLTRENGSWVIVHIHASNVGSTP